MGILSTLDRSFFQVFILNGNILFIFYTHISQFTELFYYLTLYATEFICNSTAYNRIFDY